MRHRWAQRLGVFHSKGLSSSRTLISPHYYSYYYFIFQLYTPDSRALPPNVLLSPFRLPKQPNWCGKLFQGRAAPYVTFLNLFSPTKHPKHKLRRTSPHKIRDTGHELFTCSAGYTKNISKNISLQKIRDFSTSDHDV